MRKKAPTVFHFHDEKKIIHFAIVEVLKNTFCTTWREHMPTIFHVWTTINALNIVNNTLWYDLINIASAIDSPIKQ